MVILSKFAVGATEIALVVVLTTLDLEENFGIITSVENSLQYSIRLTSFTSTNIITSQFVRFFVSMEITFYSHF